MENEKLDLHNANKKYSCKRNDFNCENGYIVKKYSKSSYGDASFGETNEYEEIESSCQIRKRTIVPKALNNIYNKLTKVLNNETFVQSINIEECM